MLKYKPTKSFEGIIAMFALFELSREEIETMINKYYQWLVPGGLLLIGVFGAEDCTATPEKFDDDGKCVRDLPYTFMGFKLTTTLFTKEGWRHVLQKKAFRIVHDETYLFQPKTEVKGDPETDYFVIAQRPVRD